MRTKLLLLLLALGTSSGAWADVDYTGIKLTFNRTDAGSGTATSATSDVTVNVADQDGNAITGVTASLVSTSITELKTGSAAALARTSDAVLAPSAGYGNAEGSTIEYVFSVTGLSTEFTYNTATLDVYAMTAGGGNQLNNGNTVRYWTLAVATGETEGGVADYVSQAGTDICTVPDSDGGLYHKAWAMPAANKSATSTLYIKVVLTKTDANGCYAGLGSVKLSKENTICYATDASYGSYTETNAAGTYAKTWVSSGTPALTLTNGANNINIPDGGLYNSTYTLSVPDGYIITGYSFKAVPSDGTTTSMTVTPEGVDAISIPAEGTTITVSNVNWASTTFTTTGRHIKVSNFCVTYAPYTYDTYVTDLSDLDNGKAYLVATTRGKWCFDGASATRMGTSNTFDKGGRIAIIKQNDEYYLYSIVSGKYLTANNTLYASPLDPVNISASSYANGNYQWFFSFDESHNINMDSQPDIVINTWNIKDVGNTCAIIEAAEFDNTSALAAFDNYDQRFEDYYNYHSEIATNLTPAYQGKIGYPQTSSTGYTNLISLLGKNTFTEEDYNNLPTYYAAFLAEEDIKTPPAGFYKIYHPITSSDNKKYVYADGTTVKSSVTVDDEASAIWYYTGTRMVAYKNGYQTSGTETMNTTGTDIAFKKSGTKVFGEMNIKPSGVNEWYVTDDNTDYQLNRWSQGDQRGSVFQVEEVTTLPITMHEADGAYYGTINLPVAVTLPDGLMAYSAVADGEVLTLTKVVEGGVLAANTPVVLYSEANVTELATSKVAGTGAESNELSGTVATEVVTAMQNYILGMKESKVGFYLYNNTTLPGFKAYLPKRATSDVKEFSFSFADVEDAIRAIESTDTDLDIYDLQGRRVQKAGKGLFIVNGKKVMFK